MTRRSTEGAEDTGRALLNVHITRDTTGSASVVRVPRDLARAGRVLFKWADSYARVALIGFFAWVLLTAPAYATDYRSSTRSDLVAAIRAYRAALVRVLEFNVAAVERAAARRTSKSVRTWSRKGACRSASLRRASAGWRPRRRSLRTRAARWTWLIAPSARPWPSRPPLSCSHLLLRSHQHLRGKHLRSRPSGHLYPCSLGLALVSRTCRHEYVQAISRPVPFLTR